MDNETVLIAFGDHGMTDRGGHGGEQEQEIRTVFFAHTKREEGFPMKRKSKKITELLDKLSYNLKHLDLPSILGALLDTLLPF